jgi:hypothetical protein
MQTRDDNMLGWHVPCAGTSAITRQRLLLLLLLL